jgi:peptide/nickel transport system permease protein
LSMYQTRAQKTFKRFMRDRLAVVGGIIVLILILAAVFADQLAPLDPLYQYPDGVGDAGQPLPGNARFPLGTDRYGRDVLSRLILGARVSLIVGIVANFLALMIGVVIGSIAGYLGGMVETFLMRFTDVMLSVPMLLLAMFLSAIWQPSLYVVIIVIAFCYWAPLARVIHGEVLHIKELTFVEASRALGGSSYRIVFRHIVPQLVSVILVYLTLGVATTVILEASLSYLGLGVPQPIPSWGSMVSDGQSYFMLAPWLVIYPGMAVMITVLGFNLLGDGLRDALMNRSQERSEPR